MRHAADPVPGPGASVLRWSRLLALLAVVLSAAPASRASSFYLSTDIPTDLGGITYLPWQVARNDGGTYAMALALPDGTPVNAIHLDDDGQWLFTVDVPTDLGGTTFEPRDVIRYDGVSYAMALDGSSMGIPPDGAIDALLLDQGGFVLSFDAVTLLGGTYYEPADLVGLRGESFSVYFDASAATPPVPASSNVTGADRRGAAIVISFDVPTTMGGSTYLPGELVAWDGSSFVSFALDGAWPLASRVRGLSFLADPGGAGLTLEVRKSTRRAGALVLEWNPSCSVGAEDYAIYEGTIGDWSSHRALDCSDDGGNLAEEIVPEATDGYYLVVPTNPNDEGSYGMNSDLEERPPGTTICRASRTVSACP